MTVPDSTYRLNLHAAFDLDSACRQVDYLHALGVDWIYLSPISRSASGSEHGYDVVDHGGVDAARGGPDALVRLARDAHARRMGILVDIVPNHTGIATPSENS